MGARKGWLTCAQRKFGVREAPMASRRYGSGEEIRLASSDRHGDDGESVGSGVTPR